MRLVKKAKVFLKGAFFVCKRRKICYNIGMSNARNKRNASNNAPNPLPLLAPTQAKASGLAYSAAIIFLYVLSMIFSIAIGAAGIKLSEQAVKPNWYIYLSYLMPQTALFLAAAVYFAWLKRPVKAAIRGQKCHPKYFLVAIVLQVGLLSLSSLNDIFIGFLERFGYEKAILLLPDLSGFGLIATIFCVAVLPAIFEEILFRGIVLKGLQSFGALASVLLCGGLFALYHQSPVQTAYQFACGAAFALVALKSGSILPTVLSHFINNTLIIVLTRLGVEGISSAAYLPYVAITSLCLVGALGYLFFFDLPKTKESEKEQGAKKKSKRELQLEKAEKKSERVRFFVCALVGITVFLINWISELVQGFKG